MSTLAEIIDNIESVDYYTTICIGLGGRVSAGYKSKDCNEGYTRAEKKRAEFWDKLQQYPQSWIDAAHLVKHLRRQ